MKHLIIILFFISTNNLFSQDFYQFFSASDLAIGEANIANSNTSVENPATLSNDTSFLQINYTSISVYGNNYRRAGNAPPDFKETENSFSNSTFSLLIKKNSFGYYLIVNSHNLQNYNLNNYVYDNFDYASLILGLTYGYEVFDDLNIALGIKLIDNSAGKELIEGEETSTTNIDIGIRYNLTENLNLGIVYHNVLDSRFDYIVPSKIDRSVWISHKLQKRLDLGVHFKHKNNDFYFSAKNILKNSISIRFEDKGLSTKPSYHIGYKRKLYDFLKISAGIMHFSTNYSKDTFNNYTIFSIGFTWVFKHLNLETVYGFTKIKSNYEKIDDINTIIGPASIKLFF